MADMTPVIRESFIQYSGAVLQSRALVDARDFSKPSARQIFYSMWLHKYTHDRPYEKTNAPMGDAMKDFYIHGSSSLVGILMRSAQSFSMRYPITEVKGNSGALLASGSWAAERYTSTRLGELADYLFADIQKDTIAEWRDNYADNLQYPAVLPSKGFYNIVNGTSGIATGMASSVPQFNLKEVNEALVKLLWNKDIDFDQLYCAPDFATGAMLLNANEVKESIRSGTGRACVLRSVIEYDSKERVLLVKELPYGVYTNTICGQLEALIESEDNPGIDRFNDLTGRQVQLKIYLQKGAAPEKVLKYLYKNTSLQSWYTVNMTVLENGRYPKVMGWKQLLQAHIDHEIEVYTRGYRYDLGKWQTRVHILDGLMAAYDMIDEVVAAIKSSPSSAEANAALCTLLSIDNDQAKAILDLKLVRLSKLDITKLREEQQELSANIARVTAILSDETLLKREIEKGLREVAAKFGDARRTQILNVESEEDEEPIEIRQLQVSLTNRGNLYAAETSSLYTQRRGAVGSKLKMPAGEYICTTVTGKTDEDLLLFTADGRFYRTKLSALPQNQFVSAQMVSGLSDGEQVCTITTTTKNSTAPYILFFTKNGLLKKSNISDYTGSGRNGAKAINLDDGDSIVSVLFAAEPKIGVLTEQGNFVILETSEIRPLGKAARGVAGVKLVADDHVISAKVVPDDTATIASISGSGAIKQTSYSEFSVQGRATKGLRIQKLTDHDWMADFLPLSNESELLVASTRSCIKIETNTVPTRARNSVGVQSIKMAAADNVVALVQL